jgi:GntR family transcriptional regulator / MocR family aminotransferase
VSASSPLKKRPLSIFADLHIKIFQMLPFKSIININKKAKSPLFLQVANGLTDAIKSGIIQKDTKLLGTRAMAELLEVHRQTVVAAYDELTAQGWIETKASRGTFVSSNIPVLKPISLDNKLVNSDLNIKTGFNFNKKEYLKLPILRGSSALTFDDGFPDIRLAPVDELARAYRSVLQKGYQKNLLFYGETKGEPTFRQEMTDYLKETRGLNVTTENVMITRGSMMAIYLTAQTVLSAGDRVVVGELGYGSGNLIFQNAGAELVKIRIDDKGLDVEQLAEICKTTPIRLVYITPHHHYPTTVTMPAERRLRLLELAKTYQFCILEDDYDYDFHYSSSPILPLASVDTEGYVIYVGSLCKTISPALRVGYIVAPSELIEEMGNMRRIIDRQGDNILEAALAILFKDGTIKRHIKKSQKAYHKRRDLFCEMLKTELSDVVDFKKPNGGMAVWGKFDPSVFLPNLSEKVAKMGLKINNGAAYDINATRFGFASTNEEEIEKGIKILKSCLK